MQSVCLRTGGCAQPLGFEWGGAVGFSEGVVKMPSGNPRVAVLSVPISPSW
jgi:hypothetical protein